MSQKSNDPEYDAMVAKFLAAESDVPRETRKNHCEFCDHAGKPNCLHGGKGLVCTREKGHFGVHMGCGTADHPCRDGEWPKIAEDEGEHTCRYCDLEWMDFDEIEDKMCLSEHPNGCWVCTREAGHFGPCVACSDEQHEIARWQRWQSTESEQ